MSMEPVVSGDDNAFFPISRSQTSAEKTGGSGDTSTPSFVLAATIVAAQSDRRQAVT